MATQLDYYSVYYTNRTMAPFTFPSTRSSSESLSPLVISTSLTIGTSILVQLLTPADPYGKSLRFLKQLRGQVSILLLLVCVLCGVGLCGGMRGICELEILVFEKVELVWCIRCALN